MLQLQDIVYSVPDGKGRKTILNGVNLTFNDGERVVITGHNGSGKTTLAKIIMGIIKPDQGRIILNGEDITKLDITARAKKGLAFAFQQPVRFKGLTVGDLMQVAHGRFALRAELCEYLSKVGLCAADYLDRELSNELSGGELKRIEIAMALLRDAAVTIFDEPEAGIDLWSFENLIDAFDTLKSDQRVTIIISHQERVMQSADRLVVMNAGQVEQTGAPAIVLKSIRPDAPCAKLQRSKQWV